MRLCLIAGDLLTCGKKLSWGAAAAAGKAQPPILPAKGWALPTRNASGMQLIPVNETVIWSSQTGMSHPRDGDSLERLRHPMWTPRAREQTPIGREGREAERVRLSNWEMLLKQCATKNAVLVKNNHIARFPLPAPHKETF